MVNSVTEDSPQPQASATFPLFTSLLLTGGIVCIFCRPPRPNSLSWIHLFTLAFVYVCITAVAHAISVRMVCKVFPERIQLPLSSLIAGTWMAVAWLPLLVLIRNGMIWAAIILPLISAHAALSLKRSPVEAEDEVNSATSDKDTLQLFQAPESKSLFRAILPAVVISLIFQAALSLLIAGYLLTAGALFSLCTALAVWLSPINWQWDLSTQTNYRRIRSLLIGSLVAILLTAVALLPYLRAKPIADRFGAFLNQHPALHPPAKAPSDKTALNSFYSGVILLAPSKPPEKIIPPSPPTHTPASIAFTRPVVIPFDGAYWYFKRPDQRPRHDARVVKGDPTKRQIRSTDWIPLSMEAHQHLGTSISTSCCSAIRVDVRNADMRVGSISIELLLGDTVANSVVSLGSKVIRSSENRTLTSLTKPLSKKASTSACRPTHTAKPSTGSPSLSSPPPESSPVRVSPSGSSCSSRNSDLYRRRST